MLPRKEHDVLLKLICFFNLALGRVILSVVLALFCRLISEEFMICDPARQVECCVSLSEGCGVLFVP